MVSLSESRSACARIVCVSRSLLAGTLHELIDESDSGVGSSIHLIGEAQSTVESEDLIGFLSSSNA